MLIALTRAISPAIHRCELTHRNRTHIDLHKAVAQHEQYERCLESLGCRVQRLPAMPDSPDAVFVEDTCVVFDELAVISRPGAASRRGETDSVAAALEPHRRLAAIETPGTLDGGDVLRLGRTVYVGRSTRTCDPGIEQLSSLLADFDYEVIAVDFAGCLHLKSAVTAVAERTILINPSWVAPETFAGMDCIRIDPAEPDAANALLIGGRVIYPEAFPKTRALLQERGIEVAPVDMSELAKAEGAVTCCSVVFTHSAGKEQSSRSLRFVGQTNVAIG